MRSNKKIIYAIAALISLKLLFLSFVLGLNSFVTNSYSPEILLAADPVENLFRILFILFIISPPMIVVLLFLIWKELKKRNRMK